MADDVDDFIQQQLDAITEQIEKIDNHKVVRRAQQLLAQKAKLQAAQRSLLGAGPRTTGGGEGGTRVTQDQVAGNMELGVGYTVRALADKMGSNEPVVRGHLNRGDRERFFKHPETNLWYRRDPEHGFESHLDIDGPEDDDGDSD